MYQVVILCVCIRCFSLQTQFLPSERRMKTMTMNSYFLFFLNFLILLNTALCSITAHSYITLMAIDYRTSTNTSLPLDIQSLPSLDTCNFYINDFSISINTNSPTSFVVCASNHHTNYPSLYL